MTKVDRLGSLITPLVRCVPERWLYRVSDRVRAVSTSAM
jgi:hypothetical protein